MTPADETKIVAKSIEIKAGTNIEIHSGKAMNWGASNVKINGSGGVTMAGSKVNLNCGNAQSPQAPTADPQDIADPYEARGQSQQAQQSQSQAQQSPPPPSSTSTTSSTPPPSSQQQQQEQEQPEQQQEEEKPEEKDHFALWLDVAAINGGKLSGNDVEIIDPDTKKVVGKATVDDDGKVHAKVPENKPYNVKIVSEAPPVHTSETGTSAASDIAHLSVHLYDKQGMPLAAGTEVSIKGGPDNVSMDLVTNEHGGIDPTQLEEGAYEIHVGGEVFIAHTLRKVDSEHGASAYQFQLGHDEGEPEYEDLSREHRINKADLDLEARVMAKKPKPKGPRRLGMKEIFKPGFAPEPTSTCRWRRSLGEDLGVPARQERGRVRRLDLPSGRGLVRQREGWHDMLAVHGKRVRHGVDSSGATSGDSWQPKYDKGEKPLPPDFYALHNGFYLESFDKANPKAPRPHHDYFADNGWKWANSSAESAIFFGLAYEVKPQDLRRGDMVGIDWSSHGGHAVFVWDVHLNDKGEVDCFQFISSNGSKNNGKYKGWGITISGCGGDKTPSGTTYVTGKPGSMGKGKNPLFEDRKEHIVDGTWFCVPGKNKKDIDLSTFKDSGAKGQEHQLSFHDMDTVEAAIRKKKPKDWPKDKEFVIKVAVGDREDEKRHAAVRSGRPLDRDPGNDRLRTEWERAKALVAPGAKLVESCADGQGTRARRAPHRKCAGQHGERQSRQDREDAPPKKAPQADNKPTPLQLWVEQALAKLAEAKWIDKGPGDLHQRQRSGDKIGCDQGLQDEVEARARRRCRESQTS